MTRLLRPEEAAEIVGLSRATLAKLRCVSSTGPVFVKLGGAVRYPADELEAWCAKHARRRSTSDVPVAA